jgi:hypothetical protein
MAGNYSQEDRGCCRFTHSARYQHPPGWKTPVVGSGVCSLGTCLDLGPEPTSLRSEVGLGSFVLNLQHWIKLEFRQTTPTLYSVQCYLSVWPPGEGGG